MFIKDYGGWASYFGFHDDVLPFFEQLNDAVSGVRYEGSLSYIADSGTLSVWTRKVSFDGSKFETDVEVDGGSDWCDEEDEDGWDECME